MADPDAPRWLAPASDVESLAFDDLVALRRGRAVVLLDRIGSLVWQALGSGAALSELVDDLAAGFGAPRDVVDRDVTTLIDALDEQGILAGDNRPERAERHEAAWTHLVDPPNL